MPASRKPSATPATSGFSGPMTTKSTPFSSANAFTAAASMGSTATFSTAAPDDARRTEAVPPLPGATQAASTFGDLASAQVMACSRPPDPSMSMRIIPILS